jgi:hypothetical protein
LLLGSSFVSHAVIGPFAVSCGSLKEMSKGKVTFFLLSHRLSLGAYVSEQRQRHAKPTFPKARMDRYIWTEDEDQRLTLA